MILVDTGAWFASLVASDQNHAAAMRWLRQNREPLLTTDYVIDETLTLLRAKGKRIQSEEFGQLLFSGQLATIYYLTPEDIEQTWSVFRRDGDKDWSFTDGSSKVVTELFDVRTVFTFDHHFRQFGHVQVVP
ncbi:MAG: PIN domain-containing protein [Cyanobacteria bacterium J06626_23]